MSTTVLRQQLLVMYLVEPNPGAAVAAWSVYDGTGRDAHKSGDAEKPPYPSVLAAMQDGWRVIQIASDAPPYPGSEYTTALLRFGYVLERMVEL